jgi:hypothetical protein
MSNGDAERLLEGGAPVEAKALSRVRKMRAVKKKTTKKRAAETAAAKVPAKNAAAKKTTTQKSNRTTSGYVRVQVGSSDLFVSRETADALTNKDLKRLRAVFKRVRKRARKRTAKKNR